MGERLNKLGRKHWSKFATQDYFDANGVFFTALVSGPLLLLLFVILVSCVARQPRVGMLTCSCSACCQTTVRPSACAVHVPRRGTTCCRACSC